MKKIGNQFYRRLVLRLVKTPAQHQRSKLLKFFLQNFTLSDRTILLDIGGFTEGLESLGKACTAIIVNLETRKRVEGWDLIIADGRYLPLKSKSIDIVMSNALLEHVNQIERLVREIRRVSKGKYLVSVPHLYSAFDPHYLVPFFQFVPEPVKKFLLLKIGLKIGWMNKGNYHEIRLFRRSQLKKLFPDAQISFLWIFGIPVNLIALRKAEEDSS